MEGFNPTIGVAIKMFVDRSSGRSSNACRAESILAPGMY